MKATTSFLIAPLFALAPIAAHAETPSGYVTKAGAGDLFEQTSSKLMLRSTKDAKVRSFATMMVEDHNKSSAMVKAAAAKSRVRAVPPQMTAEQKVHIAALTKATGEARDKLYWEQQKAAHAQALALHKDYAANGTAQPLKAAAAQIAPVVQKHIDTLGGGGHAHN